MPDPVTLHDSAPQHVCTAASEDGGECVFIGFKVCGLGLVTGSVRLGVTCHLTALCDLQCVADFMQHSNALLTIYEYTCMTSVLATLFAQIPEYDPDAQNDQYDVDEMGRPRRKRYAQIV